MSTNKRERRINGRKASTDLYFPLHQFLFYEPKYRKLSNNARVLYSILRDRYKLSLQTSQHVDTYIDSEGDIYCILDNTELSYLLAVSEPTAIKAKKELHAVELLDEEYVKDEPNRLYVLEPELTTDNWTYMAELDEIRKQKREKKTEQAKKRKEKNQSSVGDLNNFSHQENKGSAKNGDLNNFSHVTKESLEYTKVFVIQTDFTYFSKYVGKSVTDLLIDFYNGYFKKTKYAKIELTKMSEEQNTLLVFEAIKRAIDGEPEKPIAYIKATLSKWNTVNCETLEDILNYEKEHHEQKKKDRKPKLPKKRSNRTEIVPDWLKEEKEVEESEPKQNNSENLEEEQKRLDEVLNKYKRA
ncbi:replication initiator protein A [Bacillus wiedmannii]|uniref:replication initiator protein A n=1 Tax=Bacillus wiedmannii TaxID=1890302 RepID=UPI0024AD23E2|nr:replication initiator protein A [Bacillus wiedmannii]MDI6680231.1 replication initiator protein A [Bacillus wiedmannii]